MLFKSYLWYSRLSVTWGSTKSKSSIKCEDNKNVFMYNKSEWRNGYYDYLGFFNPNIYSLEVMSKMTMVSKTTVVSIMTLVSKMTLVSSTDVKIGGLADEAIGDCVK